MCVDPPNAASQVPVPQLGKSVAVRVALPHRKPRESHLALAVVVHAICALTHLMLSCRSLELWDNQLTSLAGVTFPASLT
jgi:hypothetical protein